MIKGTALPDLRAGWFLHLLALAVVAIPSLAQAPTAKRVALLPGGETSAFAQADRIAVVVGVGGYPDGSGLSLLQFAAKDARDVGATLKEQGYAVRLLVDGQATGGAVRRALGDLREQVLSENASVLFYFSGHGFEEGGKNYLATYEATVGELARTGLALDDVSAALRATRAQRQVVLVDACRNPDNTGGKFSGAVRSLADFGQAAGLRALLSTKAQGVSWEAPELGNGVFTHFLLRALKGEAARDDGLVSFRDVTEFVTRGVRNWGLEKGRTQVPYEAGEASGDFLLAGTARPVVTTGSQVVVQGTGPTPRTGDVRVGPDGLPYVYLEPGRFRMGCLGEPECAGDEKPAHEVELTRGFWLGQTEVTVAAFGRFVAARGYQTAAERDGGGVISAAGEWVYEKGRTWQGPGVASGPQHPVTQVSFADATAYCAWAGGGRLPTEAEWEYAARAGSTSARYGPLDEIARYADNSGRERWDSAAAWGDGSDAERKKAYRLHLRDFGHGPAEVGGRSENAWKLEDMLGNVWEWVEDSYQERAYEGRTVVRDPLETRVSDPERRVVRGGSWDFNPRLVRVADRGRSAPGYRYAGIGFRCARDPSP